MAGDWILFAPMLYLSVLYTIADSKVLYVNRSANVRFIKVIPDCIKLAAKLIKKGEVIAIPTDTVYGLAADPNTDGAIERLYQIKGRPTNKPIAICLSDHANIGRYGHVEHIPDAMFFELFPGPVTVVLDRTEHLNPNFNRDIKKVAIRIPNYPFVTKLITYLQKPIALTSANRSNRSNTIHVDEFRDLWPELGMVFDKGTINNMRIGSTIVDLSVPGRYKIIREGSRSMYIKEVLRKYELKEA